MLAPVTPTVLNGIIGVVAGILVLLGVMAVRKMRGESTSAAAHCRVAPDSSSVASQRMVLLASAAPGRRAGCSGATARC